jgi:hypothetical protein
MNMYKYPMESIVAAINQTVDEGFHPIDDRVHDAGLDPHIVTVAAHIGREAADSQLGVVDREVVELAGEVNFLHGVLFGLTLAANERALEEATVTPLHRAHPHYRTLDDAHGLAFHDFGQATATHMARVNGPFSCTTDGCVVQCRDGWLAVDTRGNLYPIADVVVRDVFTVPGDAA